jgi:hypothetical protein
MSEAKTYLHLSAVERGPDDLFSCDLCGRCEIDDITEKGGLGKPNQELIPMYRDARDGCVICRDCAESGAYLEIETGTERGGEPR